MIIKIYKPFKGNLVEEESISAVKIEHYNENELIITAFNGNIIKINNNEVCYLSDVIIVKKWGDK